MRLIDVFFCFVAIPAISRAEFNLAVQQDVHGTWRSSVVLPCSYSPVHYTPHSVTWRMHGQMILARDDSGDHTFLTKDRGRLSLPRDHQGGDVSLTIMNLQIDDGGQYSCEVSLVLNGTSGLLKKESVINLDVMKVAVTKPLIQPEGSFLEVSEGATVNLTCSAEGSPPITYRWYKRDQTPGSGRVYQSGGVSLLIENFQTPHSGTYYCEAENKIPASSTQQSEEVHLSITDDTTPQVTTPKSGMVSTEGAVPTEWSGSTLRTKAPTSANAGAASQTPPSTRIPKTIIYNTESYGNRRPYNTDATETYTPVNNMTTMHSAGSSASKGLPLYYIILIIVLSLAFLCILIVALVIHRKRRKTSGPISEMPTMTALNARASQDSSTANICQNSTAQVNGTQQISCQDGTVTVPRKENEYQLATDKDSVYQAMSLKPENEYDLLMQPRHE